MNSRARPVYLDPVRLRLPLPGWVSLLHRVSGALLFLALPAGVWALSLSLGSEAGFRAVAAWLAQPWVKGLGLVMAWAFFHHLLAGLRHLAMDAHLGVTLAQARTTSRVVVLVSAAATLLLAGWWFA